ncbi:MAG: N-acetyl-gamma-glutamyl-phosphate reductase [Planctomycetota bacterium]
MRFAIVGATGYAGRELCGLLDRLTCDVELFSARTEPSAAALDPLGAHPVAPFDGEALRASGAFDGVFLCLPHGVGTEAAALALEGGARVVDLSADLRFSDPEAYRAAYGVEHPRPDLMDAAVYGLTEHERSSVKSARLVANPGCYPTASLLALLPLVDAGLVPEGSPLVLDAKSGVSGAGKSPSDATLYGNVDGNCRPYGVGTHRHAPEIASRLRAGDVVRFVPQVVPMFRGMLVAAHLEPALGRTAADFTACLHAAYDNEPFVHVADAPPETRHVAGTNHCHLAAFDVAGGVTVLSVIDNLVKGAAGQALQNMNLALGLDETEGLL